MLDPNVEAAIITGFLGVVGSLGVSWRRKNKSVIAVRKSLNRQETLENYAYTLRRRLNAAGVKPPPWPVTLMYLRENQDEGNPDDE
jgi:hypothetical protein